jgi:hypothetical protein
VGTALRVVFGLGLLYLAGGANGLAWGVEWYDPVVGLIALPAIMVALGLAAGRYADGPLRFTGLLGIAVNVAVIAVLIANPYTGGGAALFYGRDDQVGCPTLTPIDEVEALRRKHATATAP